MRRRPEGVNYGSAGVGSTGHLGGALFGSIAGLKAQHVPYRGSGPMLQDLVAGNIQFSIDSIPGAIGLIRGGAVRALAVTARSRVAELPDIPTTKEAALPEVEMYTWVALFAPAGTPPSVVAAHQFRGQCRAQGPGAAPEDLRARREAGRRLGGRIHDVSQRRARAMETRGRDRGNQGGMNAK